MRDRWVAVAIAVPAYLAAVLLVPWPLGIVLAILVLPLVLGPLVWWRLARIRSWVDTPPVVEPPEGGAPPSHGMAAAGTVTYGTGVHRTTSVLHAADDGTAWIEHVGPILGVGSAFPDGHRLVTGNVNLRAPGRPEMLRQVAPQADLTQLLALHHDALRAAAVHGVAPVPLGREHVAPLVAAEVREALARMRARGWRGTVQNRGGAAATPVTGPDDPRLLDWIASMRSAAGS